MFQDVVVRRIGQNKGTPRIYLDMAELNRAKFNEGTNFSLKVDEAGKRITLEVCESGVRKVSGKEKGKSRLPVIDIVNQKDLGVFDGFERVRIIFMQGRIFILPLATEIAQRERITRLVDKVRSGKPLGIASLCHGAGMLNHAAHEGLKNGGVNAKTSLINEIDEVYASQSRENNPVWDSETKCLVAPMQELMLDEWLLQRLPRVEIAEIGIPCSGASKAGAAKNKLKVMEEHSEVGHLIVPAISILAKMQPVAIVMENVEAYANCGSSYIARSMFRDMGYEVQEVVLDASKFGCLEARVRWFLVAATHGLKIDLSNLEPAAFSQPVLGDILETIEPEDTRWSELSYLKEKEVRDKESGKGFMMQTVNASSTKVPTIRKHYSKMGSTDPFVEHPTKPGFLRKFTSAEHAKIKGHPVQLINGLPETSAHQVLGQGVAAEPVKALFKRIGECIMDFTKTAIESREVTFKAKSYSLKGTG